MDINKDYMGGREGRREERREEKKMLREKLTEHVGKFIDYKYQ